MWVFGRRIPPLAHPAAKHTFLFYCATVAASFLATAFKTPILTWNVGALGFSLAHCKESGSEKIQFNF